MSYFESIAYLNKLKYAIDLEQVRNITHCDLMTPYGVWYLTLVKVMACCLVGVKGFPKPTLMNSHVDP